MNKTNLPMENIKIVPDRIRMKQKTKEEYELLKKSIKMVGLSNPIVVTQNLELIDGFWRLKAFKKLHEEMPDNEDFFTIPALIVLDREEIEALIMDFKDGKSSDYMRDTACDRLNMLYKPENNKNIPLHEVLGIHETELKNRIKVGQHVRECEQNDIDMDFVKMYADKRFDHTVAYKRMIDITTTHMVLPKEEKKIEPEIEEGFDINRWL